jgi:hypothetical protein
MICKSLNLDLSENKISIYSFYQDYKSYCLTNPLCDLSQWPECYIVSLDLQTSTSDLISRDIVDEEADPISTEEAQNTDNGNNHEQFLKDGIVMFNIS